MKKYLKHPLLLALALVIGMNVVEEKEAKAIFIAGAIATHGGGAFDGEGFLIMLAVCSILIPVCLLDHKVAGQGGMTPRDLALNGYSTQDVKLIEQDQSKLVTILRDRNIKLKINPGETAESIAQQIQSIDPSVSPTYLQYFVESAGLK